MESTQNKTRCPHSKKCGGCQLQNLDYKEQLAHKERTCIRLLGKSFQASRAAFSSANSAA